MCGRYVIYTADELIDLHDIVEEAQRRADAIQGAAGSAADGAAGSEGEGRASAQMPPSKPLLVKTGEIFPTNIAPVLIPRVDTDTKLTPHLLESHPMVWGFPQFGGKKGVVFNTRLETASEKHYWRDSLIRRRCVVPMSGFFEWQHGGPYDKQRYLFNLPDEPILYLAGVYKALPAADVVLADRFSIMTTAPNASIREIHNRMPVVLRSDEIAQWLCEDPFAFIDRSGIALRQQIAS